MIKIGCPKCPQHYTMADERVLSFVKCPACGRKSFVTAKLMVEGGREAFSGAVKAKFFSSCRKGGLQLKNELGWGRILLDRLREDRFPPEEGYPRGRAYEWDEHIDDDHFDDFGFREREVPSSNWPSGEEIFGGICKLCGIGIAVLVVVGVGGGGGSGSGSSSSSSSRIESHEDYINATPAERRERIRESAGSADAHEIQKGLDTFYGIE